MSSCRLHRGQGGVSGLVSLSSTGKNTSRCTCTSFACMRCKVEKQHCILSGDVKPDFHQKPAYVIMDLNPKLKLLLGMVPWREQCPQYAWLRSVSVMPAHCQSSPTGFPLFVVKNRCIFQGYLNQDMYLIHVYKEQVFHNKSDKAVEQVAWRRGESLPLETFKVRLNGALNNLILL